jgi:hypothetical protein
MNGFISAKKLFQNRERAPAIRHPNEVLKQLLRKCSMPLETFGEIRKKSIVGSFSATARETYFYARPRVTIR